MIKDIRYADDVDQLAEKMDVELQYFIDQLRVTGTAVVKNAD